MAMSNLGLLLKSSGDGPEALQEGSQWLHRAAEAGDAHAQGVLGLCYRDEKDTSCPTDNKKVPAES